MAKGSKDNEMGPMEEMKRSRGMPNKSPLSMENELPEGMSKPSAEGEMHMGGVHKSDSSGMEQNKHLGNSTMGAAVRQLSYETERGEHAPSVGGHDDAGMHHTGMGVMKKA
jgi:hypothetical protein